MSYSRIKSFGDFASLNEGKIPMYIPGDNLKASKSMRVVDVARDFKKIMDQNKPFTVVVNTEGLKGADPLKPEMDVVSLEKSSDAVPIEDLLVLKDYKGREFKIKFGKIEEIILGDSVEQKVFLNTAFFVDGKSRMRILDFDGKEIKVYVHGEGERKIPLEEWKKMKKTEVD
jgi:hypothetical protein